MGSYYTPLPTKVDKLLSALHFPDDFGHLLFQAMSLELQVNHIAVSVGNGSGPTTTQAKFRWALVYLSSEHKSTWWPH